MRKIILSLKIVIYIALFWILLPVINVHAASLETLQVSSLSSIPIQSTTILEAGKIYVIEAGGTYTFAPGGRIADAEFAYDPDINLFYEELEVVNKEFNLDLFVNGESKDWLGSSNGIDFYPHTFSPNHNYRLYIEGQGQPLSFYIYDSSYDWNEGYLTVTINSILPTDKNDCKNQSWKSFSESFKNQGLCIKNISRK